ncbi:MAG: glycosyltransferase family 2 protein [Deltaproteobacteria bacterium]|uniref:Glycosyltransferase family 2 protein n=1 Tax=Candidatus Zymogenus saltonus TaxID=2844893 RepID=A0A9D8KDR3_9DELT|nr:glycosyltransferase family 2 protein [Candidatus Zymogenus saltonus]
MEQTVSAEKPAPKREAKEEIAALIPAYNSEDTVGRVVDGIKEYVPHVVVVNDGSTDKTEEAAAESGAVVVNHKARRGKGEALKTGFAALMEGGYGAILTMDADLQHDPGDIPPLIEKYREGGFGIVIGSRMASKKDIPRYRLVPNLVGNFFLSNASGRDIEDSQSGMRIYSARLLKAINLTTSKYDTEAEAIIKGGKAGFDFAFVPIKAIYAEDQKTYFRPVVDTYLISIVYLRSLFWKRGTA